MIFNGGAFLECNLGFYVAGVRVAQACDGDAKYFAAIDECVPLSIASTAEFLDSFSLSDMCTGGAMATQAQIDGMQFCNLVQFGLNITFNEPGADYSALFDISMLLGMCMVLVLAVFLS